MPTIKHFSELDCWLKARKLCCAVYDITKHGQFAKDFALKDQIQRASVSTMSNIAEGFGYDSDKQFLRYLSIARGSACEVESLLFVALDQGFIEGGQFQQLQKLTEEIRFLIAGLQKYLRK